MSPRGISGRSIAARLQDPEQTRRVGLEESSIYPSEKPLDRGDSPWRCLEQQRGLDCLLSERTRDAANPKLTSVSGRDNSCSFG